MEYREKTFLVSCWILSNVTRSIWQASQQATYQATTGTGELSMLASVLSCACNFGGVPSSQSTSTLNFTQQKSGYLLVCVWNDKIWSRIPLTNGPQFSRQPANESIYPQIPVFVFVCVWLMGGKSYDSTFSLSLCAVVIKKKYVSEMITTFPCTLFIYGDNISQFNSF